MAMPSFQDFLPWRLASSRQEALTAIDTAWLRMDRPTNLMMICGVMMFAERIDLQELREVIRSRMLCFHRFRQRVVEHGGNAHWETDPDFDLDWHVRRIALPDAGGDDALEEVAGDLISTPLDPAKPRWQYHLIDNPQGGTVVLLRIHHCYGDGFALTHVVASMTDTAPDEPQPPACDVTAPAARRSAWERILGPVSETVGDALRSSLAVVDAGRDLLAHPLHAIDYLKNGADLAYDAAVIAGMAADSPTRFKGTLGVMKRVAWAEPLSLFEVKAVAEALQCSVNDVLVACAAGAMRAYLQAQGDPVDGVEVRALVPVNMRPPGPLADLGNCFGMLFLNLSIGVEDPVGRVFEVHRRMAALKHSWQPQVSIGILAGMAVAPGCIKERVLDALAANASMVITNVRGTEQPRYFAGKRITRQMFWVPQSGGIGLGVSILSYAGQVSFGIVTDAQRVAHPKDIATRFAAEFEMLLLSVLMLPWQPGPWRQGH